MRMSDWSSDVCSSDLHEITEFFIGWLRRNPPAEFDGWTWDSRRGLAIQGDGEAFRREMIQAYSPMAENMPGNGLQDRKSIASGTSWSVRVDLGGCRFLKNRNDSTSTLPHLTTV